MIRRKNKRNQKDDEEKQTGKKERNGRRTEMEVMVKRKILRN